MRADIWNFSRHYFRHFASTDGSGMRAINRKAASELKVAVGSRAVGAFELCLWLKSLCTWVKGLWLVSEYASLFTLSASTSNNRQKNQGQIWVSGILDGSQKKKRILFDRKIKKRNYCPSSLSFKIALRGWRNLFIKKSLSYIKSNFGLLLNSRIVLKIQNIYLGLLNLIYKTLQILKIKFADLQSNLNKQKSRRIELTVRDRQERCNSTLEGSHFGKDTLLFAVQQCSRVAVCC